MVILGRQAQSTTAAGQEVLVCTLIRLESQDKQMSLISRLVFGFFIVGELAGPTESIVMLVRPKRVPMIFALFLSEPGLQWGQCRHGLARTAQTLAALVCLGRTLSGNHWQNCNLEPGSEYLT